MHLDPLAGLAPSRRFGPWAADLDRGERVARLRSLRALARVLAGPRAAELCELLHQAETDDSVLPAAADALDALAPLDMRKVLASYAALARPLSPARSVRPGVRAPGHSVRDPGQLDAARRSLTKGATAYSQEHSGYPQQCFGPATARVDFFIRP
jgi:hypothetical protein